jgi:hypothetical protein
LAGKNWDREIVHVVTDDMGDEAARWVSNYSVFEGSAARLGAELDSLFEWCRQDPAIVATAIDCRAESVSEAIRQSYYTLQPCFEAPGGDDGESAVFLFCVLRTVRDLFLLAGTLGYLAFFEHEVEPHDF